MMRFMMFYLINLTVATERVDCKYNWEDLVLPLRQKAKLWNAVIKCPFVMLF